MTSEEITTKLNAGEEAISTGDFDRAEALAAELLSLDTINNYRYHALRIQSIASMQRGDFTRALAYGNEALEACEAAGDPAGGRKRLGVGGFASLADWCRCVSERRQIKAPVAAA